MVTEEREIEEKKRQNFLRMNELERVKENERKNEAKMLPVIEILAHFSPLLELFLFFANDGEKDVANVICIKSF